jgi:hypothetical protein
LLKAPRIVTFSVTLKFDVTNVFTSLRPLAPTSVFRDSLSCLNFGYPYRAHPCGECRLNDFVPEGSRSEITPCYRIPLDAGGETVEGLELKDVQRLLEEKFKAWLRERIRESEIERAEAGTRIY